jgi:predicted nucleic acid-binding protein
MVVVDTNLLVYLLLPTPYTALAETVFAMDSDWLSPPLVHSELRNVLLGAVRRGDITKPDAEFLLARAMELITLPNKAVDGNGVFNLAVKSGCSAYDCEFVWLANHLSLPLLTMDKKVLAAFSGLAVAPEAFVDRRAD